MTISSAARRVARLLKSANQKVVFAESCTGGLVSGALTKIAGVSSYHCGGMVVYRNETKMAYLGIPAAVLEKPGPVSREVAERMALAVLEKTPEANVAVSVTGHLGPDAPPKLDGLVFATVAWRTPTKKSGERTFTRQIRCPRSATRAIRQRAVVLGVLEFLSSELQPRGPA